MTGPVTATNGKCFESTVGRVIDKGREKFRNFKDFADQKLLKWRVNAILSNRGRYFFVGLDLADKVIDSMENCVEAIGNKIDQIIDNMD
uniref:Uncharacterized protein n=1 Tax=Amphimedon queenslandica TaxID=400682 RepID=A0A1X7TQ75_AMPQE